MCNKINIKPCPFCGHDMNDIVLSEEGLASCQENKTMSIECSQCECLGPFKENVEKAAIAWNARPINL